MSSGLGWKARGVMGALLLALTPFAGRADTTNLLTLEPPRPLWKAGPGEGFVRGTKDLEVVGGAGYGVKIFGTEEHHDWWLGSVQFGWMVSDTMWEGKWYRGNFEFVSQVFGGMQFRPDHAYVVGVTPMLRYNFAAGNGWVPFIDGGSGATLTDIRNGDLSTTFEFNLQGAIGAHYFLRDNLAFTMQARLIHLSNASIKVPNLGVNNMTLLAGISWFF